VIELIKELIPVFTKYKGRLSGGFIGFLAGLLWVFKGFGAALVFVFCVVVGFYLGSQFDREDSIRDILSKMLPPKN